MSDARLHLSDLVFLLRERAKEASDDARESGDAFQSGRAMAYYEVLSTMQSQADAFQIPRSALGLDGFDPIEYLTTKPDDEDGR